MQTYHYVIDLNERGTFKCHVENADSGEIIFEFNNEDEENGLFWLIEDGYMRANNDMVGLSAYLTERGLIRPNDKIIYKG